MLLAGSLVGAAAILGVAWVWDDEPRYEGKRLSEWAEVYELSLVPGASSIELAGRGQALEAVRHARGRLLPWALKEMRYEKPPWKDAVMRVMERRLDVRRWCPVSVWGPFYGDRGEQSLVYFEMLGSEGGPAVACLTHLMEHGRSHRVRERAMFALACVGEKGLRPLMEVLGQPSNPDRRRAAYAIGDMKRHGALPMAAVPLLAETLKDPDVNVSCAGATVLGELALGPEIAIPALTNCLRTSDSYLRRTVVEALGQYGESARCGIPALIAALGDPDVCVREEATNALVRIAPGELDSGGHRE